MHVVFALRDSQVGVCYCYTRHLQLVRLGNPASRPVSAVEPIFQVYSGLSYQIVRSQQIPIEYLNGQHRVLRKRRFDFETSIENTRRSVSYNTLPTVNVCRPLGVCRRSPANVDIHGLNGRMLTNSKTHVDINPPEVNVYEMIFGKFRRTHYTILVYVGICMHSVRTRW